MGELGVCGVGARANGRAVRRRQKREGAGGDGHG